MSEATVQWTETWLHGSSLTWDAEAVAGYLHIDPSPDAFAAARTVEVDGHRVMVDLDDGGRIRGVEVLSGPVEIEALLLVLRRCKWDAGNG